jgi:hypothetical protein
MIRVRAGLENADFPGNLGGFIPGHPGIFIAYMSPTTFAIAKIALGVFKSILAKSNCPTWVQKFKFEDSDQLQNPNQQLN